MPDGSSITALLGPTNTGKTHRAVERMLAYDSGIIGLPLRLLAREVYDRITTRIGEARVALVTGEEKRLPRRPDYWVCTVESMPVGCEVDFVAVDEVQLAAHDQRGHVFTERLQSARGRRETWFLGADTMRPVVGALVPAAKLVEHPRLSRLSSTGTGKLSRMPPRTAVVAFSTPQVYEIAERLRGLRGGAAVVLGALSPRTRNAQVALFQSGEVDYLVATDAIGMGLNLEVNHIAFAALRKFDGREVRDLDPAELAQIAGRAGRYLNDGTFGTVAPIVLSNGIAAAIEAHRFAPVRRVLWRNSELDPTSIDSLTASLVERPRSKWLKLVEGAEDAACLVKLAEDAAVRTRARGREAVSLLWEVCKIPNFRKCSVQSHVALLADLFAQLAGPHAAIDTDWMAGRVADIDDTEGDLDMLLERIASIRIWTYIAHQTRWVRAAGEWQDRTRAIEDRLSDALHDHLVQRFVERGGGKRGGGSKAKGRRRDPAPQLSEQNRFHPFAGLSSLRPMLAPLGDPKAARDGNDWVEPVIAAAHDHFTVDGKARIFHGERLLGRLCRGQSLLLPQVKLTEHDDLGQGARARILRRLVAFARDLVHHLLSPLHAPQRRELLSAARGIVYQLEQGLGTVLARDAEEQLSALDPRDRERLGALDVVLGGRVIYVPSLLSAQAIQQRLALCRAYFDTRDRLVAPRHGAASLRPVRGIEPKAYAAIGYPILGSHAIRADVIERLARACVQGDENEGPPLGMLATAVGCSVRDISRILRVLSGD